MKEVVFSQKFHYMIIKTKIIKEVILLVKFIFIFVMKNMQNMSVGMKVCNHCDS